MSEILNKIKAILFAEETPTEVETPVEQLFVDIASGEIIIRVDGELAIDAQVAQVIVAEDGAETLEPLTDGEYSYEGGVIVIVNSTITELKPIEDAPVDEIPAEMEEVPEVEFVSLEIFQALEERINALESSISTLIETNQTMSTQIEEFAKAPGAPAVKTVKSGFAQEIKTNLKSQDEKLKAIQASLNKNKK